MKNKSTLTVTLMLLGMAAFICVGPTLSVAGPIGYSVQSNGNDHLYAIDLTTGIATDQGLISFGDAEGLAFVGNELYTIGGSVDEFWNITTPPGALVGATGARSGVDAGLDYNSVTGKMYNINESILYEIDIATGAATFIGSHNEFADGMAISSNGTAYVIDGIFTDSLYTINLADGSMTLVGGLGSEFKVQFGLSFADGALYGLNDLGEIYNFSLTTGTATFVAQVNDGNNNSLSGFEGLATQSVPEPSTLLLLGGGLLGLAGFRRKFKV